MLLFGYLCLSASILLVAGTDPALVSASSSGSSDCVSSGEGDTGSVCPQYMRGVLLPIGCRACKDDCFPCSSSGVPKYILGFLPRIYYSSLALLSSRACKIRYSVL